MLDLKWLFKIELTLCDANVEARIDFIFYSFKNSNGQSILLDVVVIEMLLLCVALWVVFPTVVTLGLVEDWVVGLVLEVVLVEVLDDLVVCVVCVLEAFVLLHCFNNCFIFCNLLIQWLKKKLTNRFCRKFLQMIVSLRQRLILLKENNSIERPTRVFPKVMFAIVWFSKLCITKLSTMSVELLLRQVENSFSKMFDFLLGSLA